MKKQILILLLALAALPLSATYKTGYYSAMNGKSREALKEAAKQCVLSHTQLEYTDLPNYWQYSDVYPSLVNGCKRWWDMYSDGEYLISKNQNAKSSFSANKMQREHSVPKSWWKQNGDVEYTPAYSDMWNLYPADGPANQAKLNYPLGPTSDPTFDNGVTKVGPAQNGYGGGCAYVFEPADEYKGDFARAYFYMATVYDDINWVVNYMYQKNTYPTLKPWAYNMLLDWARQDPVSQKEIDRNDVVEQYQKNRNPFVDFPELAEYIWGSRTTEVFYVDSQSSTDPTPPITGDPEITSPVNGESLDFGEVIVGTVNNRVLQIEGNNLTQPLSVRVVGTDKDLFKPDVTSIPAATMNQNQGYLLNIAYTPTTEGRHEARIVLYDGGIDASIAVTLRGEAVATPTMTTLTALDPTDVTESGYTANWMPAEGVADYYLVTRIRMVDGNQETDTYETGDTYYVFTDREESVSESYYVQYSRLGLLSEPSNTIYVAAGSGVDDLQQESPVRVYQVEGGFIVFSDGPRAGLRVYDMSGASILAPTEVNNGEIYTLPKGIYIVTAPDLKPMKLAIY